MSGAPGGGSMQNLMGIMAKMVKLAQRYQMRNRNCPNACLGAVESRPLRRQESP
jgi:hypothetical protein